MSHGNTYSHTYTNWYCNAEASFNYKQFSLYWQMNTNWNNFWGETLSGGGEYSGIGDVLHAQEFACRVGSF